MITVYSKTTCPSCIKAKTYLTSHGIEFNEVNVAEDDSALAFIKDRGHRSVPQLYVGEHLLVEGGNDGLQAMSPEAIRLRVIELQGA
jgi:glutaredoxin